MKPVELPHIRNITVSGRIASGSSTLAQSIADALGWEMLNGGALFRAFTKEHGLSLINTLDRPDQFDLEYEERVKTLLRDKTHYVIESHLAGFDAQDVAGVFKILVACEDENGEDKADIRIDRLVNRDERTVGVGKLEVFEREKQNLEKWRRLYANNDENWVYWDKKYYDFVANSYSHNPQESLQMVLEAIGFKKP